jgi:uncharacterized OsmC-like protein
MTNLNLTYSTNTSSTGIHGRAITSTRGHNIVVDDHGGEEWGAGELFLSGIGTCAVNMIGRIASTEDISLSWIQAEVNAYREADRLEGEISVFDRIDVNIRMWGLDKTKGQDMVDKWKRR